MKAWKILLCIGAGVLLIGIIIFLVGLGLNGWKFRVEYEMRTYLSTEEDSSLDLNLAAGEMNVVYYDGDVIEVEYPYSFQYSYDVYEKNGKLTVEPLSTFNVWFGWNKIPAVTVKIPQGKVMNLELSVSAGVVKIQGGEYGNVKVSLSAGWIDISGTAVCNKFDASLSAGKLDVDRVECSDFDLDLSAGSAMLDCVQCDKIKIDLSAGSVNLSVSGKKSDYYIIVDKSAGSCNVGGQQGAVVGKVIDIDLSAGSVNVSFTD